MFGRGLTVQQSPAVGMGRPGMCRALACYKVCVGSSRLVQQLGEGAAGTAVFYWTPDGRYFRAARPMFLGSFRQKWIAARRFSLGKVSQPHSRSRLPIRSNACGFEFCPPARFCRSLRSGRSTDFVRGLASFRKIHLARPPLGCSIGKSCFWVRSPENGQPLCGSRLAA